MMAWDQIGIGLFGVTAVFLSQDKRSEIRKYACLVGICSQPFWFYSAFVAEQWGIFGLSFLYTFGWGRGIWLQWIKPRVSAAIA